MPSDPDHIACWQRLDSRTTTSGRLAAEDVSALAAAGVRHVINLALPDSPGALPDEAELMARAGLRYTHVPVPFDAPRESHYRAFCKAYDADCGPVHVHCIMNWRVSAFFYRYHRDKGMSEADAKAIMQRQWSPDTSEAQHATVWADFIHMGEK
ncbi:MAG: protein tyrosine phosphatase family protein [Novosphingobium sp.]